jgi:hypothetical protein
MIIASTSLENLRDPSVVVQKFSPRGRELFDENF